MEYDDLGLADYIPFERTRRTRMTEGLRSMVRETVLGIREARRNSSDSVLVAYVDGTGAPVARYERTNFPTTLVRSRKEHREDWIAVLVANHLFAALDALVAANLWDLPAEISIGGSTRSAGLAVRLSW